MLAKKLGQIMFVWSKCINQELILLNKAFKIEVSENLICILFLFHKLSKG